MIKEMNELGSKRIPFIFIINYSKDEYFISDLRSLDNDLIKFKTERYTNINKLKRKRNFNYHLEYRLIDFNIYKKAFDIVHNHLVLGNSFLCNLTFPSEIISNFDFEEILYNINSKYILYWKDRFLCFSPETFVKIMDNKIYTYPMKGTIKADLENAEERLLNNEKEKAEHITIVDLLRNDLSIVSKNVRVNRYRYCERIKTIKGEIIQTSSEICGDLDLDWHSKIGEIIFKMLPAGSITGAPKYKTMEIIKEAENYNRGFYTGIFGIYDGNCLDSAVLIRFIEKINDRFYYKSGGGITIYSDCLAEYNELKEKIYVPVF